MQYKVAILASAATAFAGFLDPVPPNYSMYATGVDSSGKSYLMDLKMVYDGIEKEQTFKISAQPLGSVNRTLGYLNHGNFAITVPGSRSLNYAALSYADRGQQTVGTVVPLIATSNDSGDESWGVADGKLYHDGSSFNLFLCTENINGEEFQIVNVGDLTSGGGIPFGCTQNTTLAAQPI